MDGEGDSKKKNEEEKGTEARKRIGKKCVTKHINTEVTYCGNS